jgi:2-methylcitrate dehydratase PrpD
VLESKDGFLQAFSGKQETGILLDGLGDGASELAVTHCYIKPYACCRHLHPAIDAVLDMMHSARLECDAIDRVEIGTYPIGAEHAHTGWTKMAAAQMSYPYVIATALKHKAVTLAHFRAEHLLDPEVNALCQRITVSVDPECDRLYPSERTAKVRIIGSNAQCLERFVRDPYGSATNPMSDEALIQKFEGLADPVLGTARTQAVSALVMRLETIEDMAELNVLLGAATCP